MKLVLFTAHYPFGKGEEFIEDELKIAKDYFEDIYIYSFSKIGGEPTKFLPENARVVRLGGKKNKFRLIKSGFKLISKTGRNEMRFAKKAYKMKMDKRNIKMLLSYFYTREQMKSLIKQDGFPKTEDCVYYSYWLAGAVYAFDVIRKINPNAKFISRVHSGDCYANLYYLPFRREVIKNLDELHVISEKGKESIEKYVLPYANGHSCDIKISRLGTNKSSEKLNPEGKNDGKFTIVSCSWCVPVKRLDLIIDALAKIEKYNVKWVHFGNGELFESLQIMAQNKLANKPNIEYNFKGAVKKAELLKYYENEHIDLFVNSSDMEGVPVSIMEAMSFGIPTVARDIGGNREIVSEKTGELLPENISADELRAAIERFCELGADKMNEKRKNAFETFDNEYNARKNYTKFYGGLVNEQVVYKK